MPTALSAYSTSIGRARNLLETSKALVVLAPVVGLASRPSAADDLLRGSVVLGVSALDGFVHHSFSARFVPYLRNNPGSMAAGQSLYVYLRSIGVPVTALKLPPPVKGKRPLAPMRAAVDARLFLRSLQKVSEIERAFAAVGLPTAVADLAGAIGLKTSTLRSRITKITNRRNTIAHQGDLFIGKKKRFVTKPISEREVVEWLNRIDDFVTRLDSYITANPP